MLVLLRVLLLIAVASAGMTACNRSRTLTPGEAVVDSVEGIDPSVLASLPAGITPEMVEQGRQLYVVCSVCHGFDGRGTQLGPTLRGPLRIHITGSIEEIEQIVRTGVPTPARF